MPLTLDPPISIDGEWDLADQQAVEDIFGVVAVRLMSNEPGVANDTADIARIQRVGEESDSYIYRKMGALGYVTPLTGMDADTTALMRRWSATWVGVKLNEPRMLTTVSGGRNASAIDKLMEAHMKPLKEIERDIAFHRVAIVADRLYSRPPYAKVFVPLWNQSVPILP